MISCLLRQDFLATPYLMRSAKVTRLRLVFKRALSQHTIEIGYTLLFLILQATHFFLPLFPQGLFAAFLGLELAI